MADDLSQEIFVKVWQHMDRFREESKISTWIYRIAVNTCLMHLRKIKGQQEKYTDEFKDEIADSDSDGTDSKLRMLRSCIKTLDEFGKMIITLVLESVPQKEIAEITGLTNENVRIKVHRSKGKLFKCISLKEKQENTVGHEQL
jgi:RNA polymerase sigma-70 factor (ECF subfamily)